MPTSPSTPPSPPSRPGKTGRPSKFTPEARRKILAYVANLGMAPAVAASNAGVSERTFMRWKAAAAAGVPRYRRFWQELKRALDVLEGKLSGVVVTAALPLVVGGAVQRDGDPELALRLLTIIRPKRWSQRIRVNTEETLEHALEIIKEAVDGDTMVRILDALDARLGEEEEDRDFGGASSNQPHPRH